MDGLHCVFIRHSHVLLWVVAVVRDVYKADKVAAVILCIYSICKYACAFMCVCGRVHVRA